MRIPPIIPKQTAITTVKAIRKGKNIVKEVVRQTEIMAMDERLKNKAMSTIMMATSLMPQMNTRLAKLSGKINEGQDIFVKKPSRITVSSLIYCLLMIDRIANKMDKVQEERIKKLEEALEYENEDNLNEFKAIYTETIYYKGYAYKFDENGFVDKTEINNNEYLEKSDSTMIKELTNQETSETKTEEITINEEQGE